MGNTIHFLLFMTWFFPPSLKTMIPKHNMKNEKGYFHNRETKLILLLQGFPLGLDKWWGHIFCKNTKKLQENCKINIFGATKSGDMVGKANFYGSGGRSPSPPTRVNAVGSGVGLLTRKIRLAITVMVESWITCYSLDLMVLTINFYCLD